MVTESEWSGFYRTLDCLGPRLLEGVPPGFDKYIRQEAEGSDSFWSSWLRGTIPTGLMEIGNWLSGADWKIGFRT